MHFSFLHLMFLFINKIDFTSDCWLYCNPIGIKNENVHINNDQNNLSVDSHHDNSLSASKHKKFKQCATTVVSFSLCCCCYCFAVWYGFIMILLCDACSCLCLINSGHLKCFGRIPITCHFFDTYFMVKTISSRITKHDWLYFEYTNWPTTFARTLSYTYTYSHTIPSITLTLSHFPSFSSLFFSFLFCGCRRSTEYVSPFYSSSSSVIYVLPHFSNTQQYQ